VSDESFEFAANLTVEQQAILEQIERLEELNPEVTERLARALDRLQRSQPYQELGRRRRSSATISPPQAELSEAERVAHEEFITQELSSLLAIAGKLNQALETSRLQGQPDQRFRERLKAELKAKK
jgi:hypothetical protein